jgi:hypothetical protein
MDGIHAPESGIRAIGGMRLLAAIGSGERATVHLADSGGQPVAVKALRAGRDPAEPFAEATVLWRARGPHVVRVLDGVADRRGVVALVLEHLEHGLPPSCVPGAAATLLVPVVQEVARLHRLGVVHGALGVDALRLDGQGRPVLVGFGRGRCDADPAAISAERRRLVGLAAEVLSAASWRSEGERTAIDGLLRWLAALDPDDEWTEDFARRLLDAFEPEPVLSDHAAVERAPIAPGSAMPPRPLRAVPAGGRLRGLARGVRTRFGAVRPRFWIPATAIVGVSVLTAALLAPGGSESSDGAPAAGPTVVPTAAAPTAPRPGASEDPLVAAGRLAGIGDAALVDRIGDAAIVSGRSADGAAVRILLLDGPDGWQVSSLVEDGGG